MMNERIQQLIYSLNEKVGVHWTNEDKLKFARLIIKECLEQVRDEVQYEHDWKLADDVSKRVLKHFGVEE